LGQRILDTTIKVSHKLGENPGVILTLTPQLFKRGDHIWAHNKGAIIETTGRFSKSSKLPHNFGTKLSQEAVQAAHNSIYDRRLRIRTEYVKKRALPHEIEVIKTPPPNICPNTLLSGQLYYRRKDTRAFYDHRL